MNISKEELIQFASGSPQLPKERRRSIGLETQNPDSAAAKWLSDFRRKCEMPLSVDWIGVAIDADKDAEGASEAEGSTAVDRIANDPNIKTQIFDEASKRFDESIRAGEWNQAAQRGQQALTFAMNAFGVLSHEAAWALGRLSDPLAKIGSYAEAKCVLKMALSILEMRFPPNHRDISTCCLLLGDVHRQVFQFGEALHFLVRALIIREHNGDNAGMATVLSKIGLIERTMGKYNEAVATCTKVVTIRLAVNGDSSLEAAMALDNLAQAQMQAGKMIETITNFEAALAIFERLDDRANLDKAICLDNYGMSLYFVGKGDEAIAACEKARSLFDPLSPAADTSLAKCLENLGMLHLEAGKNAKAMECLVRSKAITERCGQPEPLAFASILNSLATAYSQLDDSSSAKLLEEARQLLGQGELKQHPLLAAILNNSGVLAHNEGDFDLAERFYREAEAAASPRCIDIIRENMQGLRDERFLPKMIYSAAA